jgi:hypothetical protein
MKRFFVLSEYRGKLVNPIDFTLSESSKSVQNASDN